MKKKNKKKLSHRQRKAAQLLHAGCKITKIAKELDVDYITVIRWRNSNKRFIKYLHSLEQEFIKYIDRKQKYLVDITLKQLRKLLKSKNPLVAMRAVEVSLKVNARFPEQQQIVINKHEGEIINRHEGEIDIHPEKLDPQEKNTLKRMLSDLRELSNTN